MPFKKRPPTPERRARNSQPTVRSGAVFSYHANRSVRENSLARDRDVIPNQGQTNPLKRLARANWLKRLSTLGTLLFILLLTVFCLRLDDNIKVITLGEDKSHIFLRNTDVYKAAAQSAFASVFNRNKLTVNTQRIAADLQRQFPELKVVSVSLPVLGSQPIIYIQPTAPQLIMVSPHGMFLLDSNGRALIAGNQVAKLNEMSTPVVTDQSNLPIATGEIVLPRSTVRFIGEVHGQLKAKGLTITSMTLPPGTNELHARIEGAGYYIKFNLHGNAREEAGTFLAVKARLESEHTVPHEYIDVRVENRAYLK